MSSLHRCWEISGKVQVLSEKKYVSCCVVVKNIWRNVFAVPTPSLFADPAVAELEAADAAKGTPESKLALRMKLQVMAERGEWGNGGEENYGRTTGMEGWQNCCEIGTPKFFIGATDWSFGFYRG